MLVSVVVLFRLQQTQQIVNHAKVIGGQISGGDAKDVLVEWQFGGAAAKDAKAGVDGEEREQSGRFAKVQEDCGGIENQIYIV